MPALTAVQMKDVAKQLEQRQNTIQELVARPFDLKDKIQLQALKKMTSHFEFSVHRMFIFQAMADLTKLWSGFRAIEMIFPIPQLFGQFMNYSLYLGLAGMVVKNFNMNDFYRELTEMQTLYNWVMKEGQLDYQHHMDNRDKIAHPEIQRLMHLIAPFSEASFMIAWDKITDSDEENAGYWFAGLSNAYSAGASFFHRPTPKELSDAEKIHELKTRIEKGEMQVGLIEGLQRAGHYFSSSPEFRMMATKEIMQLCQMPVQMLKDAAPSALNMTQTAITASQKHHAQ